MKGFAPRATWQGACPWFHAFSGDRAFAFWTRADRAGSALPSGGAVKAVGYGDDEANEAIRLSGCHLTPEVVWAVGREIDDF